MTPGLVLHEPTPVNLRNWHPSLATSDGSGAAAHRVMMGLDILAMLLGTLFQVSIGEPAAQVKSRPAVGAIEIVRIRSGIDPEFVHGNALQRLLARVLPEKHWPRRLMSAPVRVHPSLGMGKSCIYEFKSRKPLPVWSNVTLTRVYRDRRVVRYQGDLALDWGAFYPFQEYPGGWFAYGVFPRAQPDVTHFIIECRSNDPGNPWRELLRIAGEDKANAIQR